jgi:AraC-like DNA-binding protein
MPDSNQDSTSSQAATRQELHDLAWRMPMLRVAERFGVSSRYLARIFTELKILRPASATLLYRGGSDWPKS